MTDFGGGSRRKKGVRTPMAAWFVAGALLLGVGGGGWWMIRQNEHNSEQQLIAAREMTRTFGQVLDNDPARVIATTPKSDGDAGAIEKAARVLCAHIVEDDRALGREIEALQFDKDTFDSTSEVDIDGIDAVRDQVIKARAVVARYRALRSSRVAEFRSVVGKVGMPLSDKETMLKRFNRALESSFYDSDRLWRVRDEVLRLNGELIAVLERSRGGWRKTAYGVSFTDQAAWREFDKLRWSLNQTRWELREINSKGLSNARRQLEAAARNLGDRDED